jgi:hypothetical protein
VGAFAWNSPTSHDSALLQSLVNGPYTAQIAGQSGDTGIALAEVYDATPAGAYTPASPRLVNISARVQVGTAGNILIAGFVVGRDVSKKLELDAEFYGIGTFNNSNNQQTLDAGARYKLRPPFILLLMAGRSVAPARNGQPYFVGYFGMQFLLPPKPFE